MSEAKPGFAWGHININVSRLEESISFYEKLGFEMFLPGIPYLGLTSGSEKQSVPPESAKAIGLAREIKGRACIMQLGNGFPKIDLTEYEGVDRAAPLSSSDLGLVRFCLASQDLQGDYARLADEGVKFLSAPQEAKDGLAEIATCVDPDGTLIELIQIHLEKWSV